MIYAVGKGRWGFSFVCQLGCRHRLRLKGVSDRREAEKAYYNATGGPCPTEEKRRVRAEAAARQAEEKRRALEQRPFNAVAGEYLGWARIHRPRSVMFREKALAHLVSHFQDRPITSIEPDDIETYLIRRRDAGAAGGTVNRERAVLSHLFTKAQSWKYVPANTANPVKGTERQPEAKEKPRPLTPDEEARLLARLPKGKRAWPYWRELVTLDIHTGLRLNEVRCQAWRDIDLPGGALTVTQPKSGKLETIPLNATARSILASLERRGSLVFPDLPKKTSDVFIRYATKVGLAGVTFHCLRDTFISRLAPHVATPTLMALARHGDYRTTRRYVKVDEEHLRRAVESLETAPLGGKKVATVDEVLAEVLEKAGK